VSEGGCKHRPGDEGWGRDKRPEIDVSWDDATKEHLPCHSHKTGKPYRLLSEAEWEHAAAGRSNHKYSWGDEIGRNRANCKGCGSRWDYKQTAPVGWFEANAFGLYEMHGNVLQWVQDNYHPNYGADQWFCFVLWRQHPRSRRFLVRSTVPADIPSRSVCRVGFDLPLQPETTGLAGTRLPREADRLETLQRRGKSLDR
jgi:formylglycine-generating enzyme required for sulfatase activity